MRCAVSEGSEVIDQHRCPVEASCLEVLQGVQRPTHRVLVRRRGHPVLLHQFKELAAYRWHCQHHRIDRLADLIEEVRTITGETSPTAAHKQQRFSSGRELLEAVTARRAEAQAFKALAADLADELPDASAMDSNRIDGVKVLWLSEGRAARDETAFRQALATAHQLRESGKRMSDAAIIDAYEKAYNVAQAVGADNRAEDMPPMRDRQTMARRVRGYVTSGKTTAGGAGGFSTTASVNSRERKAALRDSECIDPVLQLPGVNH